MSRTKQLFRAVTFLLFVGGWALASSAIYVVRTPSKVMIFPKNQLLFHDTLVDTRNWTVADDREHPALVARVIQLGRADMLAHTVNIKLGPVETQLAAAVASPILVTGPSLEDKARAEAKTISDGIKAKLN